MTLDILESGSITVIVSVPESLGTALVANLIAKVVVAE